MKPLIYQRATVAYAVMLALTVVSFCMTVGQGGSDVSRSVSVVWAASLVLAGIKVRLILLDFMELRSAPWGLRLGSELVVLATIVALITIYEVV